ncbi:MAG: 3-methyl-2-oxobutanoate hydroxymethyltransferase [Melioribacter sp.]|uniref:3-methyl-2-oxobutanoate hydroxymethyltransferase n=1 Tax=Rosettibacter primus TaxID=3111523 RepID=UPI00247EA841|nr:3-methyl-2-oxobutanoate hydroxymethyltransferase [Melioribacter sp.]
MKTVNEFKKLKSQSKKISMVTCYDYWSAKIIDESDIDAVLVGDSAAMVMHGFETTINAEIEMMCYHTAAVKRGLKNKLLISDLPFLSNRKGISFLMESIDKLMKAGAQAVKIEGADDNLELIQYVINSGIPVMGHIGLTPQFVHQFGGYKLQGKDEKAAEKFLDDAKKLEDAGCFAIVLEMMPSELSAKITKELSIPTIGIGAGPFTDGQILVLQDLLGMSKDFQPKFLRKYLNGFELILNSLNKFNDDVKNQNYPNKEESY